MEVLPNRVAVAAKPVTFFDRYSGEIKQEAIFGERFLRWTYGTGIGRTVLETVVKKPLFSRLYGWWMSRPASCRSIQPFIEAYDVDTSEFTCAVTEFSSFNDFFARRLKPEARPIDPSPGSIVFPADGRHLGFANVGAVNALYAKGQQWDLPTLLGDAQLAAHYASGSAVISRLCPTDYHCFHFPVAGDVLSSPRLINGPLYSVSPIALRQQIQFLWQNKRMLTEVQSAGLGRVLILEIGATCVGSIVQKNSVGPVAKGQLKGWFLFGGSCVITLFEPGKVQLAEDLIEHSLAGREIYARMGDRMSA